MDKHGAHAIVQSSKNAFGATILLRCVSTSEAEDDAVRREKGAKGSIIELTPIICLEC